MPTPQLQADSALPPIFPFSAVHGQDRLKFALILATLNPSIGGVLISGPRGSAKSTLARSIADLLPDEGGQPTAHRFVTLPLGTTEDRLLGSLDLAQVMNDKSVKFTPGLLHKAHQGVLYIDEVNLLPDYLVDLLLDVAASGTNIVERDGISHQHPAKFVLVGTMNPDEGELRPQLLDRFGLMVALDNDYSIEQRVAIVEAREAFDHNPQAFIERYQSEQNTLKNKIKIAQTSLANVTCAKSLREEIAKRAQAAGVDGLRADIVWYKAALASAAWHGRNEVSIEDIDLVEPLVLAHRQQSGKPPQNNQQQNNQQKQPQQAPFQRPPQSKSTQNDRQQSSQSGDEDWGAMPPMQQQTAEISIDLATTVANVGKQRTNKQSHQHTTKNTNNSIGSKSVSGGDTLSNKPDWLRTLTKNKGQWPLTELVFRSRQKVSNVLHLVLLDTSASVLKQAPQSKEKALIVNIAEAAYLAREQLAVIGFGNQTVTTLLSKKRAPKAVKNLLDNVQMGGGTPLTEAIVTAKNYLAKLKKQQPALHTTLYLITDGRSQADLSEIADGFATLADCVVIDTEQSTVKRGRAKQFAEQLNGQYYPLTQLMIS